MPDEKTLERRPRYDKPRTYSNGDGGAERLPPHSREAERSVLGSMLRDNKTIPDVIQVLARGEDFYLFANQKIFEALTTLYIDGGKPADPVTVANWLNEQNLIEDIGGYAYLAELWDAAPSAGNAIHYAEIVRQKAIFRSLIHACNEIQQEAFDQNSGADEVLGGAERRVLEIAEKGITSNTQTLHVAINEAFDRLDARKNPANQVGVLTGYPDLNEITSGFQNSELIVLAARPSVGKTAFALNVVRHVVVEEDLPTLFVSLEQSRIELAERLLCCQARINSHSLRKGTIGTDDFDRITSAGEILRQAPLYIDDTPGQNMLRIAANARRLKLRKGLRLVVIDYLQLIDPQNPRDSRQEQVSSISRRLKFLARELSIPVIALAQVNRSSEERQDSTPRLSDLRESGAIEQDADTVMILHRPEGRDQAQINETIEVHIAKQRNGPTGEVTLTYVKQFMRFENYAVDHGRGGYE